MTRVKQLHGMPRKASNIFWWPFTQHKLVPVGGITVIDSRCGENFAVFKTELARDMGYTAARFGHVMFPENVYEPALNFAELLLEGAGKGWASRVYFQTMDQQLLKLLSRWHFVNFLLIMDSFQILMINERPVELMVLALKSSYHGDTLGAMIAQAASSYTGFLQQPWYTGRSFSGSSYCVHMQQYMDSFLTRRVSQWKS